VFTLFGFTKNKINTHEENHHYKEVPVKNKVKVLTDFEIKNNVNFYNLTKKLNKVHCKSGVKQVNNLKSKYLNFKEILTETHEKDELSYICYNDKINKLSLSIVNDLKQSYLLLRSIETIDHEYDLHQLNRLMKTDIPNKKSVYEMRVNLWNSQNFKVNKLIFDNELMLTKVDFLISNISIINMENIDWNLTIDDLDKLKNNTN
jgi:hypothetical protein